MAWKLYMKHAQGINSTFGLDWRAIDDAEGNVVSCGDGFTYESACFVPMLWSCDG